MPTERIPANHGARDIERVEKSPDVAGEPRDTSPSRASKMGSESAMGRH
jgi:hypothetical protein